MLNKLKQQHSYEKDNKETIDWYAKSVQSKI